MDFGRMGEGERGDKEMCVLSAFPILRFSLSPCLPAPSLDWFFHDTYNPHNRDDSQSPGTELDPHRGQAKLPKGVVWQTTGPT